MLALQKMLIINDSSNDGNSNRRNCPVEYRTLAINSEQLLKGCFQMPAQRLLEEIRDLLVEQAQGWYEVPLGLVEGRLRVGIRIIP